MRLLADENLDRPIVAWLREQGHDVIEVAVVAPGASDYTVIEMSRSENRILLTFDRDIGRILQADATPHPGVVYLRLRGVGSELWQVFTQVWGSIERAVPGHFVTARNTQVRRRSLPMVPRA